MGTITAIYPTHKFHAAASRLLTKHTVCSSSLQVYFKAQHQFNTMALRFLKEKKKRKEKKDSTFEIFILHSAPQRSAP